MFPKFAAIKVLGLAAIAACLGLFPASGQLYAPESPSVGVETPQVLRPAPPSPFPTSSSHRLSPKTGPSPQLRPSNSPAPNPVVKGGPYLSQLGTILSGSTKPLLVHLCFAGQKEITSVQLAQGASIAEALALWAKYRPLLVSTG